MKVLVLVASHLLTLNALTPKPSGIEGETEGMTGVPIIIAGIIGAWLPAAAAALVAGQLMLPATAGTAAAWLAQAGMPPPPAMPGIDHMPAVDDMAGVLVELTIGVPPVFIMLFGLWLNWPLL